MLQFIPRIVTYLIIFFNPIFFGCNNENKRVSEENKNGFIITDISVPQNDSNLLNFMKYFANSELKNNFIIDSFATPYYLLGNFNNDEFEDIAILISNKRTNEKGVLIFHSNENKIFVFGAGNEVNNMTDLEWIEVFQTIKSGEIIAETLVDEESGDIIGPDTANEVLLKTDAILMHVTEACGGGILFWNDSLYKWFHIE